jgi:predicted DNA-binding protein
MQSKYPETILFKIDTETMSRLAKAAEELGHTRSQFIRESIARRILAYEQHERETILKLRQPTRPAR